MIYSILQFKTTRIPLKKISYRLQVYPKSHFFQKKSVKPLQSPKIALHLHPQSGNKDI